MYGKLHIYVNILYNINADFQDMQLIVYIQLLFIIMVYLSFILNMFKALNFINNTSMI